MPVSKWIAESEWLLRKISPSDFSASTPIYILTTDQTQDLQGGPAKCWGWTSAELDLRLRDRLRASGVWKGRGFATTISLGQLLLSASGRSMDEIGEQFVRVVLHEVCHFFDRAKENQAAGQSTGLPWHNHTCSFVRMVLHICSRAADQGFPVSGVDLWSHEKYKLSPIERYSELLGNEPHRLAGESLFDITATLPPDDFIQFAYDDLRAAERKYG